MEPMPDHHAQLHLVSAPQSFIETFISALQASHEVLLLSVASWGIDDSRGLITEAYRTARGELPRAIVVSFDTATSESQNALLKILEEPPGNTTFHFVLSPSCFLLPTLRSRFAIRTSVYEASVHEAFDLFASASVAERLTVIEKKLKQKDQDWLESIRQGLIAYLSSRRADVLEEPAFWLLIVRELGSRGASNKMLLEALALLLPKTR